MWIPRSLARAPRLRVAFLALSLALPSLVAAAPAPQSPEPASAAERRGLRQAIERSFEVLPVTGGVLLRPRLPLSGVKTVEIKGSVVAVNGERVSTSTVQAWLDDKADLVLRLQRMKPADRLALLGLAPAPGDAVTEEAEPAPPAEGEVAEVQEIPEAPEAPEPPERIEGAEQDEADQPAERPAPAERDGLGRKDTGQRVNVGGGVTVEKGEKAEQVVAIGGPARVEGDVDQDVVSVGSSVHIDGKVGGEVVSVGASVYLGPHAEVDGDVTSVGGSIQRQPGAKIHGSTHEVGLFPQFDDWGGDRWHRGWEFGPLSFFGGVGRLFSRFLWFAFVAFLCCLVVLLARPQLNRVTTQLRAQPWQSVGVGFVGTLGLLPATLVVMVLLAITLVGCLLWPFLWLFLALLGLLGFTAVALSLGEWVEERFRLRGRIRTGSPYVSVVLGVFVLYLGTILATLFSWMGGPGHFFGFFFGAFAALARVAALIIGFGAVILARFGAYPGYWPGAGAPPAVPGVPLVPDPPPADPWADPTATGGELPLSHSGSATSEASASGADGEVPKPPAS